VVSTQSTTHCFVFFFFFFFLKGYHFEGHTVGSIAKTSERKNTERAVPPVGSPLA
jgi:hypothetical protein